MALFVRYVCSITFKDGANRPSVVSYYVTAAAAADYLAAADQAARDATAVGILITKTKAMTLMIFESANVGQEVLTDPIVLPAVSVLRGNKLAFSLRSGGRGLTTTIPARNTASYSQEPISLLVSLTTPAAMTDWITAVENVVVDQFEHGVTIQEGRVVD